MGLLWTDWAIMAVTLATLMYLYATWTFSYWQKRGVPFVKPTIFFGNFKESTLFKKTLGLVYADMYNQLKGHSFGGFFKFRQPCLMICDPELAKHVMIKDFAHFQDNDIDITIEMDPLFGRNPFCLRGDRWKVVRSQLTPAFTPGKLKPLFPLISDVCQELREYVAKDHPDGLEMRELAAKYTTDVTATCIFGLNGNSFTDPKAEFREIQQELLPTGIIGTLNFTIMFLAPSVAKFFKMRFFSEKVSNFFRRVTKEVTTHRDANNVTRKDFLQLLMALKAKGSVEDDASGEKFTDEDVAAQSMTFFSDGSETSSIALSFTLYELALNPEYQTRLREEVDAAFKKHGGVLSYDMLQDVPYADMVLAEGMRKYPPLNFVTRLCTRAYDLPTPSGGSYRVDVGTSIAIPVLGIQRDPAYYPDPEKFDPERFREDGQEQRHPYTYMPFGVGPRGCLGMRFAKLQMKAGLTSLIHNFELVTCARTVPVVLDPKAFLTAAESGLWIKLLPRPAH